MSFKDDFASDPWFGAIMLVVLGIVGVGLAYVFIMLVIVSKGILLAATLLIFGIVYLIKRWLVSDKESRFNAARRR